MSAVVEQLRAARELISDEKHWTQGESARGKSGRRVKVSGTSAVCFCASGAMQRQGWEYYGQGMHFLQMAIDGEYGTDVIEFNDGHTHPEVIAMFDRAIALAESEAA